MKIRPVDRRRLGAYIRLHKNNKQVMDYLATHPHWRGNHWGFDGPIRREIRALEKRLPPELLEWAKLNI